MVVIEVEGASLTCVVVMMIEEEEERGEDHQLEEVTGISMWTKCGLKRWWSRQGEQYAPGNVVIPNLKLAAGEAP